MKMYISPGVSWLNTFKKKPNFIAIGEKVVIFEVVCVLDGVFLDLVATHDI